MDNKIFQFKDELLKLLDKYEYSISGDGYIYINYDNNSNYFIMRDDYELLNKDYESLDMEI